MTEQASVIVPCDPSWQQVLAGARALDAWSDEALREDVDAAGMARRVYRAMTSVEGPQPVALPKRQRRTA